MYYTKLDKDDVREITLPESIISSNRIDFIQIIDRFNSTGLETLILNIKNTKVIDSAGLGFLLIAQQEVDNHNKNLIIRSPQEYVRKTLNTICFDEIFTIEE